MKLTTKQNRPFAAGSTRRRSAAGFTLAEVLAALLFLAIVIPTAVEVLHVASLAGEVGARKSEAARVADRVLSQSIVTTNWNGSGTVTEGILDFHWTVTTKNWSQDPLAQMQLLTAEVHFSAQGKDYSVKMSTLASPQTATSTTTSGAQF